MSKSTSPLARQPVTFLDVYQSARERAVVPCLWLERESGCIVILPSRFRRGNWRANRIGGSRLLMPRAGRADE